jgi:cardiolipin synthase
LPRLPPLHLATVVGFLLALVVLGRELRLRRAPSATFAWLLAMVLVPYVGVPLYVVLGGRKRRRRAASKKPVYPARLAASPGESPMDRLLDGMGVPPASHNRAVTLLASGEDAYVAILDLIDSAQRSIHIATFILGGDEVGDTVLSRLAERARKGVEVRLLVDGLFAFRPHRRAMAELRRAGGRIAEFMPLIHVPFRGRSNLRNHRKIAVADETRAIIGGMNLAEEYMGPRPLGTRWKDVALRVEGRVAADLDALFRADWAFAAGEADTAPGSDAAGPAETAALAPAVGQPLHAADAVPVRVVASGPDVATDTLYDAILFGLFSATSRIWIATPYFVPDDALVRALSLACRRGVDVRVIVPTPSNHPVTDLAGAPYLRDLQGDGASIRPYVAGMLHAKVIVIDDSVAMVGSANFDMRSLFLNYEVMALLYGKSQIDQMAAWFEDALATCAPVFQEAGKLRAMGEDVARLLGPLV